MPRAERDERDRRLPGTLRDGFGPGGQLDGAKLKGVHFLDRCAVGKSDRAAGWDRVRAAYTPFRPDSTSIRRCDDQAAATVDELLQIVARLGVRPLVQCTGEDHQAVLPEHPRRSI